MAILSRRCIQKLLEASTRFSTPVKIRDQVQRLNKGDHSALGAEWELIVTNGLANVTALAYEIGKEGSQNVDLGFKLPSGIAVVADIVAVSDEVYDVDNPTGPLFEDLLKRLTARGISGTIGITVDDAGLRKPLQQIRPRQRLALPEQVDFVRYIFDPAFEGFLDRIVSAPGAVHRHQITRSEASLEIVYSPGRSSCSMRHGPYSLARDRERDPLYNAFDAKRKQISKVIGRESSVLRGIVLCDGGSAPMGSVGGGPGYFDADEIVRTFLTRTSSVKFVCVVRVTPVGCAFSDDVPNRLTFQAEVIGALDQTVRREIESLFSTALSSLPRPIRSGGGARKFLHWCRRTRKRFGDSYDTGVILSHNSVAVPVRALLDYAAGRLKRKDFERLVNPIAIQGLNRLLEAGLEVESVAIEHTGLAEPHEILRDGDLAVIAFGKPDPAVSDFRVPIKPALSEDGATCC